MVTKLTLLTHLLSLAPARNGSNSNPEANSRRAGPRSWPTSTIHTKAIPRQSEALQRCIFLHCIDDFHQKLSSAAFKQPAEREWDFYRRNGLTAHVSNSLCASLFLNYILLIAPCARTKLPWQQTTRRHCCSVTWRQQSLHQGGGFASWPS